MVPFIFDSRSRSTFGGSWRTFVGTDLLLLVPDLDDARSLDNVEHDVNRSDVALERFARLERDVRDQRVLAVVERSRVNTVRVLAGLGVFSLIVLIVVLPSCSRGRIAPSASVESYCDHAGCLSV